MGIGENVLRSFEEFYSSEYPSVFRAVYFAFGDTEEARDASQEAFKRAFVKWRQLSRQEWAGGWVMTTALNVGRRMRRSQAREIPTDLADDTVSPIALEDHVDLLDAVRTLPKGRRSRLVRDASTAAQRGTERPWSRARACCCLPEPATH